MPLTWSVVVVLERTRARTHTHKHSIRQFHRRFISGFVLILGHSLFPWNFTNEKTPASKVQTTTTKKFIHKIHLFSKELKACVSYSNRIITLLVLLPPCRIGFISYLNLESRNSIRLWMAIVVQQYHFNSHLYNISVNRFKGADSTSTNTNTHINAHADSSFTLEHTHIKKKISQFQENINKCSFECLKKDEREEFFSSSR